VCVETLETRQLLSLSPQFADGLATLTTAPTSVATDPAGDTYVAGNFNSSAVTPFSFADADGYVAKYNSAGQEVWVKHIRYLQDIQLAVDPGEGNVYAYGYSAQATAEVLNPNADNSGAPIVLNNSGNVMAQLIMFSSNGQYDWSELFEGFNVVSGSITVDGQGNVDLSGTTAGQELDYISASNQTPLTTLINDPNLINAPYAFALQLQAGGDANWGEGVPDQPSDSSGLSTRIAVDSSGAVYLTDTTSAAATIAGTTISPSDTFLVKWDDNGTLLWARRVAHGTSLTGHEVAVDGSGNLEVAGSFQGTASFGPAAAPTTLTASGASSDVYLAALDPGGDLLRAKAYAGTGAAAVSALVSDGQSNVYLAGSFQKSIDLGGFNLTAPSAGGTDLFVAQVDPAGNIALAQNSGGSSGSSYAAPALSTNGGDQISLATTYSAPSSPATTFAGESLPAPASSGSALVARVNLQASTSVSLEASSLQAQAGSPITFTASVAVVAPLQGTPAGTVQFLVDGKNLGTPVALVNGTASTGPIATLAAGSHQVVAVYSGMGLYQGSTSAPVSETVLSTASGPGGSNGGSGNPGTGGSSQAVPTVTAGTAVFLKTKGKVTGLHITFSGALDQASAQTQANYLLVIVNKKGHGAKAKTQLVPVPLGVPVYNASSRTVVFPISRKPKPGSYQLQITSSASGGVHDTAGQPLVGGNATLALRA